MSLENKTERMCFYYHKKIKTISHKSFAYIRIYINDKINTFSIWNEQKSAIKPISLITKDRIYRAYVC